MSSGQFDNTKYEADAGNGGGIYAIKLQPETVAFAIGATANDPPAGAVNQPISALATPSRRKSGLRARYITFRWADDQIPAGYSGDDVRVSILTPATFALATVGATATYLGGTGTVVSRSGETAK